MSLIQINICMAAYTFGDCVYLKNMTDITNENYNYLILNHIKDMNIISPLKFINETFEFLPNLFVDIMVKECMNAHIQIVDQLSKVNLCNKENQQTEELIIQESKL